MTAKPNQNKKHKQKNKKHKQNQELTDKFRLLLASMDSDQMQVVHRRLMFELNARPLNRA